MHVRLTSIHFDGPGCRSGRLSREIHEWQSAQGQFGRAADPQTGAARNSHGASMVELGRQRFTLELVSNYMASYYSMRSDRTLSAIALWEGPECGSNANRGKLWP